MYFIDTNIFLEWLLGRKHAHECEKLLELIQEKMLSGVCSHFSIHSICLYMINEGKEEAAEKFIEFILSTENLQVINATVADDFKIFKLMKTLPLDFDDALQYYTAMETNCLGIITFDSDFKKTKIKTFTPKDIIELHK